MPRNTSGPRVPYRHSPEMRKQIGERVRARIAAMSEEEKVARLVKMRAGARRWRKECAEEFARLNAIRGVLGGKAKVAKYPSYLGQDCTWNGIPCESRAEARVLAILTYGEPDSVVERWQGDALPFVKPNGRVGYWTPDLLVTGPDGDQRIIEVKHARALPLRPTANQLAATAYKTMRHIVHKARAHPYVELWNGGCTELVTRFNNLVQEGVLPAIQKV